MGMRDEEESGVGFEVRRNDDGWKWEDGGGARKS